MRRSDPAGTTKNTTKDRPMTQNRISLTLGAETVERILAYIVSSPVKQTFQK